MRLAIFFVYLCAYFTTGDDYRPLRTYQQVESYSHSHQHIENPCHHSFLCMLEDIASIRDVQETEADYLISDEVEEEDPNTCFASKYKLVPRHRLTPSHSTVLSYQERYAKAPPSSSDQVSYKYLVQSALRI